MAFLFTPDTFAAVDDNPAFIFSLQTPGLSVEGLHKAPASQCALCVCACVCVCVCVCVCECDV